jgi:putative transposase
MPAPPTAWPHAPTHRLAANGTYLVTAGTYQKLHHFRGRNRLAVLHRGLLKVAQDFGWQLEAWAVFSNHYHFVGHAPEQKEDASNLATMLSVLHAKTAGWVNRLDAVPGRQVWFNFWESQITFEKSYLARLSYVHQNPVKHGLVPAANQYPWGSAAWLENQDTPMGRAIFNFKTARVRVLDDFEVAAEW